METNIVLALLVGLPGSGKTTLCRALKSYLEENQGCERLIIITLCYDDLIPLSVQREFVEQKRTGGQESVDDYKKCGEEGDERKWKVTSKQKDSKDWKNIEVDMDWKDSKSSRHVIGEDWKSARRKIHSQVDQFLQYINTGKLDSGVDNFFSIPLEAFESGTKYMILLDDNFYYRSMRYEFFQLARRHSAAFCQLYLECSTEEAAWHNDMREERVPADVVMAMAERLQAPQSHLHPWEANTCILKRGEGQVSQAWGAMVESFQNGLSPVEDRELEVAEARRCCSQSVVHQADLCLRTIVKGLVKKELQQPGESRCQASQVASRINAARQTILSDLRRGVLEVPNHLADAITQNNRHEFETFLEAEIKRKLQSNSREI